MPESPGRQPASDAPVSRYRRAGVSHLFQLRIAPPHKRSLCILKASLADLPLLDMIWLLKLPAQLLPSSAAESLLCELFLPVLCGSDQIDKVVLPC